MTALTPDDLIELSITAEPITVGHHWRYTIEDLVKSTRSSEWIGVLFELSRPAATTLALVLNKTQPWKRNRGVKALASSPSVVDGTVLSDVPA